MLIQGKCWCCGKVKTLLPKALKCFQCYQADYYRDRKSKRLATNPYQASKVILGCLQGFDWLRVAGILPAPKFASWSDDLREIMDEILYESITDDGTKAQQEIIVQEVQSLPENVDLAAEKTFVQKTDLELQRAEEERKRVQEEQKRLQEEEQERKLEAMMLKGEDPGWMYKPAIARLQAKRAAEAQGKKGPFTTGNPLIEEDKEAK